ncbi:hypothetical protein B0H17DRAFT_962861, partial [Mycena rosella]
FRSLVIGHGFLCVFGFAVLLPAGVLVARYMRTFRPWWYIAHWIAQAAIELITPFLQAGPVILLGVVLGFLANKAYGDPETPHSDHKTWGTIILLLYVIQCILGAVIHYVKAKNATRRPPQNYLHAHLGLTILILGMYQIRTGYNEEWPHNVGGSSHAA